MFHNLSSDLFEHIPENDYIDLLYKTYQRFLADLLNDKENSEVQQLLIYENKEWLKKYLHSRYFW